MDAVKAMTFPLTHCKPQLPFRDIDVQADLALQALERPAIRALTDQARRLIAALHIRREAPPHSDLQIPLGNLIPVASEVACENRLKLFYVQLLAQQV